MGQTLWTARDRDRRSGRSAPASRRGAASLVAVSLVSVLALAVGYWGRSLAFEASEAKASVLDLRQADAASLEGVLTLVFDRPADRRFAAREWAGAMASAPAPLPNVGALARLNVPAAAIARTPRLEVFAERLAEARRAAGGQAIESLPLFTAAQLSTLKPLVRVRGRADYSRAVLWSAVAVIVPFHLVSLVWTWRRRPGDRLLLACAHLLTTLGFLVALSRPDPLRDTLLVVRYAEGVMIGLAVCLAASFVNVRAASFLRLSYVPLAGAMVLCLALLVFGTGPGTSRARINLGPVQPSEAIRLLLCFFLAGYFARRWELVRQVRGTEMAGRTLPAWLNVPRADLVLPVFAGVGLALVLFFLQRDLGPALLVSLMFLVMFAVARGGVGLTAAGLAVLIGGFYVGHALGLSSTLSARVAMWRGPWDNAVRGGDQVAQAAWAMASGGIDGAGIGLGSTKFLPAGHTDLALASLGEEFGVVGVFVVLVVTALMVWRGLRIALRAPSDYAFFLSLGLTLSLALPALVMGAGVLGLVPLTGLVTPFLSYGGSAMIANFAALGLLAAVAGEGAPAASLQPFHPSVRHLAVGLGVAAGVVAIGVVRVQAVSADEVLVRPQLSRQADGGVRYQYNPRVMEAVNRLPRGSIFDQAGLPLATDEPGVKQRVATAYAKSGMSPRDNCSDPLARCYPLGGAAFHVLGDARTRLNWAAANTSYVERDAADRLRGFDDRATAVRVAGDDGVVVAAVRRDYRELVPLVRHKWEPHRADVRALMERPRDVQVSIDAPLQQQAAAILASAARAAGVTHAAAVMLDAATGEVLASVSYPSPAVDGRTATTDPDMLLDRARYGLYPPGSTFKLVTAAAALQQDVDWRNVPLVCSRLPGERVGVRIPGFGPAIRDDVHDRSPHGAITMHDGLVRSCNAYFAQLAVRLGPEVLARTAEAAGVPLAPTSAAARVRAQLPHAGYGQGQVLATPLRMARIAAAIGSDGMIRQAPLVRGSSQTTSTLLLAPAAAKLLAADMRDAVTQGTGRLLRDHPSRIAGKTGTAEVDDAASHAWFVGFAPSGQATRRVAFAVVLENAGYGGASAAAAAGQLVSAAAARGFAR